MRDNEFCLLTGTPVTVVGGGAAGVAFAIQAAERGASVTLFEKNAELLNETSRKTPGRMTSGFHYMHLPTALTCLTTIISLIRKFPGYRRGEEPNKKLPEDHPMRRGRYFILKTSNVPAKEILDTYNALQKEYERLVAEDIENEVFGDRLFHILQPHEYEGSVDINQVEIGIETREHLLNFERFRAFLLKSIEHLDITVKTKHELVDVGEGPAGSFNLVFKNHGKKNSEDIKHQATYIANATWSDIARLNQIAGFPMAISNNASQLFNNQTNRLKVLARVDLPESLRGAHHMFFCMGPEGSMFSNNGDGTGFLTHAHITNVAASTGLDLNDIAINEATFALSLKAIRTGKIDAQKQIVIISRDDKEEKVLRFRDEIQTPDATIKVIDIIQAPHKMSRTEVTGTFIEDDNIIRVVYRSNANVSEETVWSVLELTLDQVVTVQQGFTIREVLKGKLPEEKQEELGQKLIDGVATRIPAMKDAKLIGLNFGIVQTEGEYDPKSADSAYHKRDYYGIREQQVGWIDIAGVKLMFTPFAAQLAFGLLFQQEVASTTINNAATAIGLGNGKRNAFLSVARNRMTSYDLDKQDCKATPLAKYEYIEGKLVTNYPLDKDSKILVAKIEHDANGKKIKHSVFRTLRETGMKHEAAIRELQHKFSLFGKSRSCSSPEISSHIDTEKVIGNIASSNSPPLTRRANTK